MPACLPGWLAPRLPACMPGWLAVSLRGRLPAWLPDCLSGCLHTWLPGRRSRIHTKPAVRGPNRVIIPDRLTGSRVPNSSRAQGGVLYVVNALLSFPDLCSKRSRAGAARDSQRGDPFKNRFPLQSDTNCSLQLRSKMRSNLLVVFLILYVVNAFVPRFIYVVNPLVPSGMSFM